MNLKTRERSFSLQSGTTGKDAHSLKSKARKSRKVLADIGSSEKS
jgi:hypothetical protein